MKLTREIRFISSKPETRAVTAEQKQAGYIGQVIGFVAYGSNSKEMRGAGGRKFVERLAPGVFARSLADANQEVVADVGHNDGAVFARRGVNLEVTEDATGLHWAALVPDTTTGRDLLKNVDLGIISATSFEFEVRQEGGKRVGEEWTADTAERDLRTLKDAVLHRVNPVVQPAYIETSLATRAQKAFTEVRAKSPELRAYVPEAGDLQMMDPTMTGDCAFACEMLCHELEELDSALEYLRAYPSGALASFATEEAQDSADDVTMLVAWLAANGAQSAMADGSTELSTLRRAQAVVAEQRSVNGHKLLGARKDAPKSESSTVRQWAQRLRTT